MHAQGAQVEFANKQVTPEITIRGMVGTPTTWSVNTYWRGAEKLQEAELTPLQRGHIYTAQKIIGDEKWLVSALRLLDEEGGCLLDGLSPECADTQVRTRFPGKIRDLKFMSRGFYLSDDDLLTFRQRVVDAGGSFSSSTPLRGEWARSAMALRDKVRNYAERSALEIARTLTELSAMTQEDWESVSARATQTRRALQDEYRRLSEDVKRWEGLLTTDREDPDQSMASAIADRTVREFRAAPIHRDTLKDDIHNALGKVVSGQGVQFPIEGILQTLKGRAWWLDVFLQKLGATESDTSARFLNQASAIILPTTDPNTQVELSRSGFTVRLNEAALEGLVTKEIERRRTANIPTAGAAGGRFDLE